MKVAGLIILASLGLAALANAAADREIRVGVAFEGPISGETSVEIQNLVERELHVKPVPIVYPGSAVACAKRFVGGELDDRLDGVILFSLPPDSFTAQREAREVKFSGTYSIITLNLSTMREDRHSFTFSDSEPVLSGVSALLAVPAQLVAERTTGTRLVAGDTYQASQSVQARVESKLVTATRLYLPSAPIKTVGPLNPLETAQHLLDQGEGEAAMAVFQSEGINKPEVVAMIAAAKQQMAKSHVQALLGKTLGAVAAGDGAHAQTLLASYEKEPNSDATRADALQRVIGEQNHTPAATGVAQILKADIPGLDQAAFVAMVKQMFSDEAGTEPAEVQMTQNALDIEDRHAADGVKTRLDGYATAVGKSAELLSLRCGCEAQAQLRAENPGAVLLKAKFGPSSTRPQVGLP